jgi:Fe-S-cluster containining protein
MEQGISALPAHHQKAIAERLQMLSPQTPVVCPFLDQDAGACLIYEHRPAACRTYGFYVERDKGLWCGRIASADTTDVVWGNQCAVDCRLDDLGPRINLREWFKR